MKKRFKRIYIEILNYCNLNCSFCVKTTKKKKQMSISEFSHVLDEIKEYTDYIYLHVQGEPLLHKDINEIINIANKKGFFVNLTTNGTLITDNFDISNIRQINISLQAKYNDLEYYDNIINLIKRNKDTYISLRVWGSFDESFAIKYFEKKLNSKCIKSPSGKSHKLIDHVFFSIDEEFTWPSLSLPFVSDEGTCEGGVSHLGILSDGTVVPCCLDKDGIIDLGNIFIDSFDNILSSDRYVNYLSNLKSRKLTEELCRKCSYRTRFK